MKILKEDLQKLQETKMVAEAQTLAAENAQLRLKILVMELSTKYGEDLNGKTLEAEDP